MEKNINLAIHDGEPFFAHELSVHINPIQFVLDFKCITPRNDARSQSGHTMQLKHNPIMITPHHAKMIHDVLGNMLKKYEQDFGSIEKSKAVKAFEKKQKANTTKPNQAKEMPSYFG